MLPVVHATVEEMTLYIFGRVLSELGAVSLLERGIESMEVMVAEAPGQEARVELDIVEGFDVEEWEETGFNGALEKDGKGVKPCGSGEYGVFFGRGCNGGCQK